METIASLEQARAELALVCQATVAKVESGAEERELVLRAERDELTAEKETRERRLGRRSLSHTHRNYPETNPNPTLN